MEELRRVYRFFLLWAALFLGVQGMKILASSFVSGWSFWPPAEFVALVYVVSFLVALALMAPKGSNARWWLIIIAILLGLILGFGKKDSDGAEKSASCVLFSMPEIPDENDPKWIKYSEIKDRVHTSRSYYAKNGFHFSIHSFYGVLVYKEWACVRDDVDSTFDPLPDMRIAFLKDGVWHNILTNTVYVYNAEKDIGAIIVGVMKNGKPLEVIIPATPPKATVRPSKSK